MRDPRNPNLFLTNQEAHELRERMYERQMGMCCWCLGTMKLVQILKGHCPDAATIEHLQDRLSHGGRRHDEANLALSCWTCNNKRNSEREKIVHRLLKQRLGEDYHLYLRGISPFRIYQKLGISPAELELA
jgi:hypothetical protein